MIILLLPDYPNSCLETFACADMSMCSYIVPLLHGRPCFSTTSLSFRLNRRTVCSRTPLQIVSPLPKSPLPNVSTLPVPYFYFITLGWLSIVCSNREALNSQASSIASPLPFTSGGSCCSETAQAHPTQTANNTGPFRVLVVC